MSTSLFRSNFHFNLSNAQFHCRKWHIKTYCTLNMADFMSHSSGQVLHIVSSSFFFISFLSLFVIMICCLYCTQETCKSGKRSWSLFSCMPIFAILFLFLSLCKSHNFKIKCFINDFRYFLFNIFFSLSLSWFVNGHMWNESSQLVRMIKVKMVKCAVTKQSSIM